MRLNNILRGEEQGKFLRVIARRESMESVLVISAFFDRPIGRCDLKPLLWCCVPVCQDDSSPRKVDATLISRNDPFSPSGGEGWDEGAVLFDIPPLVVAG